MKTPSPISKVSRCLKPTPLPTCRPWPQRRAAARQMQRRIIVSRGPSPATETRVQLDQGCPRMGCAQGIREAQFEIRIWRCLRTAVNGGTVRTVSLSMDMFDFPAGYTGNGLTTVARRQILTCSPCQ